MLRACNARVRGLPSVSRCGLVMMMSAALSASEFPKSLFLGCDTDGKSSFDRSVICTGDENLTRSAFDQICRNYRTEGSPHYIKDIALAVTADEHGVTDEEGVGLVLDYRHCFDVLWVGTAQNFSASDRYCADMLDPSWRDANVRLSEAAARNFVRAYPSVEFEWYVSYEANLNYFADGCNGISGDQLWKAYSQYISDLSAALQAVKTTDRMLWSPNFWSKASSTNRQVLLQTLSEFANDTPAITDIHFQDNAHAGHTCKDDGVYYHGVLSEAFPHANISVNLEMFLNQPQSAPAGQATVKLVKGDSWAQERREACYDAYNVTAGASWALKWWYLTWFGSNRDVESPILTDGPVVAPVESVTATPKVQRIHGTFVDIQYDQRLQYTNNASLDLSCTQWGQKLTEFKRLGIEYLIFQAVHDDRFGSYYASDLHPPWNGTCRDVVGAIMNASAVEGIKVWLSSEYAHTEYDDVKEPALMEGRRAIMSELVDKGYTSLPSFHGWYFSSEAYLTSTANCSACFPEDFMSYINQMSGWSRRLTPHAQRFVSPFGTRSAVVSPEFVRQLQALDVEVMAYQDEVGCIRDEFPVQTSLSAFTNLHKAHSYPNTPTLWANIESFTWENASNNVTSALIPAPFPRILAQLQAVTPLVDTVISFTAQGIYQPPPQSAVSNISWGLPAAMREWHDYMSVVTGLIQPGLYEELLLSAASGRIAHEGIGHRVELISPPDPSMASGNLTDGATGAMTPWDDRWVGFPPGADAVVVVDLNQPAGLQLQSVGAHFLAVPPLWFVDGNFAKPTARNITAWLPSTVSWAVSNDTSGGWMDIGMTQTNWWEREVFDIRAEVYIQALEATVSQARYLRMTAKCAPPPWWADWYKEKVHGSGGDEVGRLLMDELVVNFHSDVFQYN